MTDSDEDDTDSRPTQELLRILDRDCYTCGGRCTPHEKVFSIALGFKDNPRCLHCLAEGLGKAHISLNTELREYVFRRECFRRAWNEATKIEGQEPPRPVSAQRTAFAEPSVTSERNSTLVWDAGDLGCGDLVLALRIKLNAMPPGAIIQVRATDPAAPEDIPSWCRLTGHTLLSAAHPEYRIQRKES